MVNSGEIPQQKMGNKTISSLGQPKPFQSLNGLMSSLNLAEERADKILKRLEKTKPLFISGKFKDGEIIPMKINRKNKRNLDGILVIINDLVSRSVALTYAQCLDSFSKDSDGVIKHYHKNCIRTIRKIMNKLESQHKESDLQLGTYLYYAVHGYSHLTSLLFLTRKS
jgi:hypothetical protein